MKLKKFFATVLAVATVASFATVSYALDTTENFYTWKTVVTPAAVDPAGTADVEVYILGADGGDIAMPKSSSSTISATINLSTDAFAITNDSDIYEYLGGINGDVDGSISVAGKNIVIAMDVTPKRNGGITISADEPVFTLTGLPIAAEAVPGTYTIDVDSTFSTLTDASVSPVVSVKGGADEAKLTVNGAAPAGPSASKAEAANGANTNTYTFENSDAMAGKKVVMQNAKMPTTGMTADTRFIVSDGTRTQIFGSDIWAKLGAEGDGVIDVDNVIFGIIVDAANTSTFTFEVK